MFEDCFNPRRGTAPRSNHARKSRPPVDVTGGSTCALALLVVFLAAGCEGRPLPAAQQEPAQWHDGAAGQDLAPGIDGVLRHEGGLRLDGGGPALFDAGAPICIFAIRVDSCCTTAYPSLTPYVSQDPCLVPYPPKSIPAACKAKWSVQCDIVDCTWGPPLTRLVQAVPGGDCTYRTECQSSKDCTLAVDARKCCTCPASYPLEMVKTDPCIITPDLADKPTPGCTDRCKTQIICDGCPPPGKEPKPACKELVGLPPVYPKLSVCTATSS